MSATGDNKNSHPNPNSKAFFSKGDCSAKSAVKECKEPKDDCLLQCMAFTQSTKDIVVPPGTSYMKILLIGAGGGGGDYKAADDTITNGGGGGGAGGTYANDNVEVTPGHHFSLIIGTEGVGGNNYGTNGGDTVLIYGCHTKSANGGKGGGYGLSGSFGGKGGEGAGCGKNGGNGGNGTPSTGGEGGKTKVCRCSSFQYGNGGNGGSLSSGGKGPDAGPNVSQHVAPDFLANPSFIGNASHLVRAFSSSASGEKCGVNICRSLIPCSCHQKEEKESCSCCPPDPVIPFPNSVGNSGMPGYAEIKFYGCKSECEVDCDKIQHIIPGGDKFVFYIDPNIDTCIVDSSNFVVNAFLGRPCKNGHKIVIKMMYQNGLEVNIRTITGGTFTLSSSDSRVTLLYAYGVWDVIQNFQNLHSFYPTVQYQRVLAMQRFNDPGNYSGPNSVAISADGSTAVVGVPDDSQNRGAAFVFIRVNGCWEFQTKLVGNDSISILPTSVVQGFSVAISADGNTIALSGPGDNNTTGATWIFVRSGCEWIQQGTKIISSTSAPNNTEGYSISLSADGNILAVGAPGANLNVGEVIIYTRNAMGVWMEQIILPGSIGTGLSVSLSSIGNVLAVRNAGDVTIYRYVAGVWTFEATIPLPINSIGFSRSIDLSADGTTLAIGLPFEQATGIVLIYVYSANTWVQQGISLVPLEPVGGPLFGFSVSLSGDGNTLAVGGPFDDSFKGATWIFTRESGLWTERKKLIGTSFLPQEGQGATVALSSEANVLAVTNFVDFTTVVNPLLWIFT